MNIIDILSKLNQSDELLNPLWVGCTKQQILELEQSLKIKLPLFYREYLEIIGISGDSFLRGSDAYYNNLFNLKESAVKLLEENNIDFKFKQTDFVFFMHQGYMFFYFDTSQDNPYIYGFSEGESNMTKPEIRHKDFFTYLQVLVNEHLS